MSQPHPGPRVTVRSKLVGLLVGTAFVALFIACAAFVYYDRASYSQAKQATLSVLVRSVAESAFGPTAFQDPDSATTILQVLEAEPSARAGAIYTQEGKRLAMWSRAEAFALPDTAGSLDGREGYRATELDLGAAIAKGDQRVGKLHVVFGTQDIAERTQRFLQIAAAVLAVCLLLAEALASLGQRVLTDPVRLLAAATQSVQRDRDFSVRAQRVSNDELGELTDAFNSMLSAIQVRDAELEDHRANLESLVEDRTRDLDARNREMRLVLDNVVQGFVMLDREGKLGLERSSTFDRWFPTASAGTSLGEALEAMAPGFQRSFEVLWEDLIDDVMPREVTLDQLPSHVEAADGRHFQLGYQIVADAEDRIESVLAVVTDVTDHVNRERSEAEQAQLLAVFEAYRSDRGGFVDFFNAAETMVQKLATGQAPTDRATTLRELHTLKGNCGLFGLKPLAALVHQIEDECAESGELPSGDHRAALGEAWHKFETHVRAFLGNLGDGPAPSLEEFQDLLAALRAGKPRAELVALAERMLHEPVSPKLERAARSAVGIARRLGKGDIECTVDSDGVRLGREHAWLWPLLAHLLRNAVDHGLESPEERSAVGKTEPAHLTLSAEQGQGRFQLRVSDNGRGIDWDTVRERAKQRKLAHRTHRDLVQALLADGFTTKCDASDISGRGVGLSAVAAEVETHGGTLEIDSQPGEGSAFTISIDTPARLMPPVAVSFAPPSDNWPEAGVPRFSSRPRPSLAP